MAVPLFFLSTLTLFSAPAFYRLLSAQLTLLLTRQRQLLPAGFGPRQCLDFRQQHAKNN